MPEDGHFKLGSPGLCEAFFTLAGIILLLLAANTLQKCRQKQNGGKVLTFLFLAAELSTSICQKQLG